MEIGLITDSINFPSVPLMKISAFHKSKGDNVEIVTNFLKKYDLVYVSKVFNLPFVKDIQYIPFADKVIFGGSGYAIHIENNKEVYYKDENPPLPDEIEYQFPDYSLYPEFKNTAYGFLTRGCPNNCEFCIISKKEGLCSHKVNDLSGFWNGQKLIKLLDPNLLACRDREDLIKQLIESKAEIDYTQGLDARFIDDDIAELLSKTKIKMIHFAFDYMKNEERILKGLKIFANHFKRDFRQKRIYILTNYNTTLQEDYYRVKKCRELGYSTYITIYRKGTHPQFLTDLQRWSNNLWFQAVTFEDYIPRKDGKKCSEIYKDILRA